MHTTNDLTGRSTAQKHRNRLFNRPLVILCLLFSTLILTLSTALAQTVLYDNIQETPQPSPLPFVNSTHSISVDFAGLQAFPESLRLDFPDDSFTIVAQQVFDPRAGYILRNATDPPGTPAIRLDPDATPADYSYLWAGTNDQYDVVITVNKGQLVATIAGNSKRYVIRQMGDDSYNLTHVYLPGLPSNADDVVIPTDDNNTPPSILVDKTSISHVKSFDINANSFTTNLQTKNKSTDNTALDVLIVYTEAARIDAGGAIGNPDDSVNMELDIMQIVDNTNIALTNSETQTRITNFHVAKLNGFTHQGSHSLTLRALKDLISLQTLRANIGADMVALIIEDAPTSIFNACGVAFSQTVENSNWTVGATFNSWAYSVVQQQCVIYDNTFAHELGHLMGTHHVLDEVNTATQNNIINNGYPYAFGWKNENFKTIMSVEPLTPSRRLYFSNPEVEVGGVFIGNVIDADNARVIDELSPAMALFQQRPDVIFVNGFE